MFFTWAALFITTSFAGVTGTIAGKPFTAVSAVAMGDAGHPGVLAVAISDQKLKCGSQASEKGSALILGFEPTVGATVEPGALAVATESKYFGIGLAKGTITKLPAKKGGKGEMTLDMFSAEGTSLSGEMTFTLCDIIAPPTPASSAFAVQTVKTKDASIKVGAPTEWTTRKNFFDETEYVAQDGRTVFSVSASCNGDCLGKTWEANASTWGKNQYGSFIGVEGYTVNVIRDEKVAEGTWVTRYDMATELGTVSHLDVIRWSPDWDTMVICTTTTSFKTAAYLDTLLPVCSAAELVK